MSSRCRVSLLVALSLLAGATMVTPALATEIEMMTVALARAI